MADSWKIDLAGRLVEPAVIVGIGNSASGDDAAGPEVVRLLRGRTRAALFDCQTVPENFIGPIARAKPKCIILVDAVPAGRAPGVVDLYALDSLCESTFHTHAASPALFLDMLVARTGAACFMIGIQPKTSGFGAVVSDEVATAAREVADALAGRLPPAETR